MPKQRNATRPAAKTAKKNPVKPQTSLARAHSDVAAVTHHLAAGKADAAMMDELQRRFTPAKLADRLEALLDAMTPPIALKSGEVVSKPDCTTRLRACDLILAYIVGRPIERSLSIRAEQPQTPEALLEEATKSPAMLDMLLDALLAAKAKRDGANVKTVATCATGDTNGGNDA